MTLATVPPRMTLVVPLRKRMQFTTNILPTATMHACRDHEIIVVLDKCPLEHEIARRPDYHLSVDQDLHDRERVFRWFNSHQALLDEHKIRVLESHGDANCWTGGLRMSAALNVGVEAATTEWIVGIGDEDLALPHNWDEALWRGLHEKNYQTNVSTLVLCQPEIFELWPQPITREWIHETRKSNWHRLAFPLTREQSSGGCRIRWESFLKFSATGAQPGIGDEACGERRAMHWVPFLMHKSLIDGVGRWPISDVCAMSPDMELDNLLAVAGVRKRMPLDSFVLHAKEHVYLSDEVDRVWGDPEMLALFRDKPWV